MASSKLRSSSLFPNFFLPSLNLVLFCLASATFAPIFLLRTPPTTFGWALFTVSSLSLLSSFVGFYSQLTNCCFISHISLLLASSIGQALCFLALFSRENSSLDLLKSTRSSKASRVLVRAECGLFAGMFMLQMAVLVMSWAVQSCWEKEYEGLELEREKTERKRSRRMAQVQEESMANAAKIADDRAKELDEKMKNKYGHWVKTDFEG